MAIFTKDGKVYIVDGPNPLVEKQVSWDPEKLVFHNFDWGDIKKASEAHANEARSKSPVFEEEKAAARTETPKEPGPSEKNETDATKSAAPDKSEFELPYIKYKVLCHCLPARVEKKTDAFYGESWMRVLYGKKFVFPCVIISSSDLHLEFWTSDPRGQITEKSIIYPFSYEVHNTERDAYDRVPYDDYRWWKVASKESKEGGWLVSASPSDFQPDFSD